jgi:hypothetical protein
MELQGNMNDQHRNGAIFDVLPSFDFLIQHLEDAKLKYTYSPALTSCINLAWVKLDEYYCCSDQSSVFVVAVLLDPRMKLQYFQSRWVTHQDWIDMAKEKLQSAYASYKEQLTISQMSLKIPHRHQPTTHSQSLHSLYKPIQL